MVVDRNALTEESLTAKRDILHQHPKLTITDSLVMLA